MGDGHEEAADDHRAQRLDTAAAHERDGRRADHNHQQAAGGERRQAMPNPRRARHDEPDRAEHLGDTDESEDEIGSGKISEESGRPDRATKHFRSP